MANEECISFYGQQQCHRKCKEGKCPGKVSGICLSSTGSGKQAPPENFSEDFQTLSPEVVNLAPVTGIKGAFF